MTISYFAGRGHLDAFEHAARLAKRRRVAAYVGTVQASPWCAPGEPLRYARWVACDLSRLATRSRVVHLACVNPGEADAVLARVHDLRAKRDIRRARR